jgi:hypothetical protein
VYILHIKQLQHNPADEICWKKIFLLPTILWTGCHTKTRSTIRARISLLLRDDWDLFTLGHFPLKRISARAVDRQSNAEFYQRRINTLAEAGEIRKVMQFITRDNRPIPLSPETLTQLRDKYPTPHVPHSENDWQDLTANFTLPEDVSPIKISAHNIHKIVFESKKLTAPGLDQFRSEHMCALLGRQDETFPDERELGELVAFLCQLMIDGKIPRECLPLIRDFPLIALPKGETDIRPIGINSLWPKIVSSFLLSTTKHQPSKEEPSFNQDHSNRV